VRNGPLPNLSQQFRPSKGCHTGAVDLFALTSGGEDYLTLSRVDTFGLWLADLTEAIARASKLLRCSSIVTIHRVTDVTDEWKDGRTDKQQSDIGRPITRCRLLKPHLPERGRKQSCHVEFDCFDSFLDRFPARPL
jgi:hypothetical protein